LSFEILLGYIDADPGGVITIRYFAPDANLDQNLKNAFRISRKAFSPMISLGLADGPLLNL
jgi:hypothetical protein